MTTSKDSTGADTAAVSVADVVRCVRSRTAPGQIPAASAAKTAPIASSAGIVRAGERSPAKDVPARAVMVAANAAATVDRAVEVRAVAAVASVIVAGVVDGPSVAMSGPRSCWWSRTSRCTATRSCRR